MRNTIAFMVVLTLFLGAVDASIADIDKETIFNDIPRDVSILEENEKLQVTDGETAEDNLVNYDEPVTASLVIVKTFTGLYEGANVDDLTFRIVGPNGFDKRVKYAQFTDGAYTFTDLALGQYLVYETNADTLFQHLILRGDSVTAGVIAVVKDQTIPATVNLVNNYENVLTSLSVMKIWDDKNNFDESRPQSLTVTLSDGTQTVGSVTLNESNYWNDMISDLPMYDASGNEINYILTEETVSGYTLTNTLKSGNLTVFVNTHRPVITADFGPATFTLPAALITIEESAFDGNTAIAIVDAGNVTEIGPSAFAGCTGLTQIRLPADCAIDATAFTDCGTVLIFAPAGGTTEAYCNEMEHENCVFVALE